MREAGRWLCHLSASGVCGINRESILNVGALIQSRTQQVSVGQERALSNLCPSPNLGSPSPSSALSTKTHNHIFKIWNLKIVKHTSTLVLFFPIIQRPDSLPPEWKLGGVLEKGGCQVRMSPQKHRWQTCWPLHKGDCVAHGFNHEWFLSPYGFSQDSSAPGSGRQAFGRALMRSSSNKCTSNGVLTWWQLLRRCFTCPLLKGLEFEVSWANLKASWCGKMLERSLKTVVDVNL